MQNTKTFSLEIEKMAQEKSITHMDAVLEYCKTKELEPESVTRLISKSLRDKIEANARDLNYLPNQAKLPIWKSGYTLVQLGLIRQTHY
mgnify:CR=1 FL=1